MSVLGAAARGAAPWRLRVAPVGWWPLALVALAPWLLAAVASSVLAPTAAYTFTLPLLLALLAHHAFDERAALAGAVYGWCTVAGLVWLLHLALGHALPLLTVLTASLLPLLAVPALAPLAARGRAALAAPLLAGMVLLLALAASPPWSERSPRPLDTFAIADHDAGEVLFASGDAQRDPWQQTLVPADAAAGSLARLVPGASAPLWSAPAKGAALGTPPALDARIAATSGGMRIKGGRFVPPPGALTGSIWIRSDAPLARLSLAGQTLAVPTANAAGWRRLRWYALPAEGAPLELAFEGDAPVELLTVSLVPGFPAPYAAAPLARLAATMPAHYGIGDATAVLKRFEL